MTRASLLILAWMTSQVVNGAETEAKATYPPLPVAVSSFGAAESAGYVYVYGGHSGKAHEYSTETVVGKFFRISVANPKAWEELPSGPPLQGLALVAHGGKLYRLGGMQPRNKPGEKEDIASVKSCEAYDIQAKKWSPLPDLPQARSSHDAVVVGDKLVVAGGWRLNGGSKDRDWHDTALVLNLSQTSPKWESISQPFQRRALNMAAHDGKVYVICGLSEGGSAERTVDVLDLAQKKWSTGPQIPEGKMNGFTPAVCTSGGRVYVSPADGKVYRLKADGWETVATLEKPRIVHRMVPIRDHVLMVLGGASREGNVALTEVVLADNRAANPAAK